MLRAIVNPMLELAELNGCVSGGFGEVQSAVK